MNWGSIHLYTCLYICKTLKFCLDDEWSIWSMLDCPGYCSERRFASTVKMSTLIFLYIKSITHRSPLWHLIQVFVSNIVTSVSLKLVVNFKLFRLCKSWNKLISVPMLLANFETKEIEKKLLERISWDGVMLIISLSDFLCTVSYRNSEKSDLRKKKSE